MRWKNIMKPFLSYFNFDILLKQLESMKIIDIDFWNKITDCDDNDFDNDIIISRMMMAIIMRVIK